MLLELRARHLGVIDDLTLVLGPGMTALTGETGAGKTLVVEAINLLLGGRADTLLVRTGREVAAAEGRFITVGDDGDEDEVVLGRIVPAEGRGRAYVDGRMVSTATLLQAAAPLVDLHGQHAHQSLLFPSAQRDALDAAAGIDVSGLADARARLRQVEADLVAIGGDPRARARELDLLRFQLEELDAAHVDDPSEEERLAAEQDRLSDATGLRMAAAAAWEALAGDGGAVDRVGEAVAGLPTQGAALVGLRERLRALEDDLADAARQARVEAESLEDDPARLDEVKARLTLLGELRRKYGPTLSDVMVFRDGARRRAEELTTHDTRAAELEQARAAAAALVEDHARRLAEARRAAAAPFAASVEAQLRTLAMPHARFAVDLGDGPAGEPVRWMLSANPGEPLLPLRSVASGGELARTMLAVRLVLSGGDGASGEAPRTLIFDEVDAGVGGEAAAAVGRALAQVARRHQVLVVTHLAQVAACADAQVVIRKAVEDGRTAAVAETVDGEARVVEVSRMLSGQPASATARRHAKELLATARDGAAGGGTTVRR